MRFILLLLISFYTVSAYASDAVLSVPVSPWDTTASVNDDIQPKKLSLSDLENLSDSTNFNTKSLDPKSTIESLYSNRIIDELEQYGYKLFQNSAPIETSSIPAGAVQGDYILSAGDDITVVFRGQINKRRSYTIDSQGRLIIDDLPPLTATGQTLNQLKENLQNEVNALHNTQIFVSLSGIRQIGVLVIGHVNKPGRQNLTAFHTALDALIAAGGIQKTGSLRKIKIVRQGRSHYIDLYQLLMGTNTQKDNLLRDGDRIIVPPIGPTIAVSGGVKRPAIYEIRQGEKLSLHQALGLVGGTLAPGQNRYMKLEYTINGEETVQDIDVPTQKLFGDGSILMVAQSEQKRASEVTLSGHTRQPGSHDLKKTKTLSELIKNEKVLGKDIYPLIGVIQRQDPKQLTKKLVSFSPYQVLQKNQDQTLTDGDEVKLFSMKQIRNLDNTQLLQKVSLTSDDNNKINNPVLSSFLKERSVFVRGAVRQAGAYPVTDNTTLENILAVAGGIALEGNASNIEITSRGQGRRVIDSNNESASLIMLKAGDTVRVNQKFHKVDDQSIIIVGEVNHPGRYDLSPGDTLSTLIERVGGLTDQAYPDGALFSRASERKREENRYKAQAQDLELKLAASLQQVDDDKKPDMTQVQATQSLITQLKNAEAVGRITVEADPASLAVDPSQDILLESGDKIYIPKRPLTVRVAGEVLNPAALQFKQGKDPLEYLRQAGGTTHYADKNRAFVIYPDGSAQPLNVSSWNHNAAFIPPGSTIIVPRDPKPFSFLEGASRVSQVIANLAISGLYIEAIGDDD